MWFSNSDMDKREMVKFFVFLRMIFGVMTAFAVTSYTFADPGDKRPTGGVVLKGTPNLPEAFLLSLAVNGQPIWQATPLKSQKTLRSAVIETCGNQSPTLDAIIFGLAEQYNSLAIDARITPGSSVAVPFCLRIDAGRIVQASSGDTPISILEKMNGLKDREEIETFCDWNPNRCAEIDLENLERPLSGDESFTLPFDAPERTFIPQPGSGFEIRTEVSTERASPKERLAMVQLQASMRVATNHDFNQTGTVDLIHASPVRTETDAEKANRLENNRANCLPETSSVGVNPFDLSRIQDRIRKEMLLVGTENLDPSIIAVVDTGVTPLERGDGAFFTEKLFDRNGREASGEDDDNEFNNFVDDVYGVRFSGYETGRLENGFMDGSIRHYNPTRHNKAEHGTQMASLALGGIEFVQWLNADNSRNAPVKLRIVNFACDDSSSCSVLLPLNELPSAISYLDHRRHLIDVVNLSLQSSTAAESVRKTIVDRKDWLFVVAAGNDGYPNLGEPQVYPASKNTEFDNMLVVGASDLNGRLIRISNASQDAVDFLALGCGVRAKTLKDGGIEEGEEYATIKGTSVSAAITSFTAALVKHLWWTQYDQQHVEVQELQHRLISSVDFDLSLAEFAIYSGVLNIEKAISLRHNVIDIRADSSPQFVTGNLYYHAAEPSSLSDFCLTADGALSVAGHQRVTSSGRELQYIKDAIRDKRLLKIIPNIQTPGTNKNGIAFWLRARQAKVMRYICYQNDGELAGENLATPIPITEIEDIVLSSINL